MVSNERKKALDQWQRHKSDIALATANGVKEESPSQKNSRIARLRRDYNAFVE